MKDIWMTALGAVLSVGITIGLIAGLIWVVESPRRECIEQGTQWALGPSGLSDEARMEYLNWLVEKGC